MCYVQDFLSSFYLFFPPTLHSAIWQLIFPWDKVNKSEYVELLRLLTQNTDPWGMPSCSMLNVNRDFPVSVFKIKLEYIIWNALVKFLGILIYWLIVDKPKLARWEYNRENTSVLTSFPRRRPFIDLDL